MTLVVRRATAVILVCLFGVVAVVLVAPVSSASPQQSAISRLGACMAAGKPGDILLVLDRSASLKQTDPTDERVTAAKYLIGQLIAFAKSNNVDLSLAIAGFDSRYQVTTGWTKATASHQSALTADVERYRTRDTGWETDYWNAVQGARRTLAQRAGEAQHCQAWVWFTDGNYELDVRNTQQELDRYGHTKAYAQHALTSRAAVNAAMKAGVKDLCRAGGLADQLREAGPITLAVGLSGPNGTSNFALMKGIATAKGGPQGSACTQGAATEPGEFIQASDMNDVVFAFDSFSSPGQTDLNATTKVCGTKTCGRQAHRFVLDSSIGSVHILATSTARSPLLVLTHEGSGGAVEIGPGKSGVTDLEGVHVAYSWVSTTTAQIQLTPGASAHWAGVWSLTFVDRSTSATKGQARSSIKLQGDIQPAWLGAKAAVLHSGTRNEVKFGLIRSGSGQAVDPSSVQGTAKLSAAFVAADGTSVPIASGVSGNSIGQGRSLDLSTVKPGSGTIRLTLELTTAPARTASGSQIPGTTLSPRTVDFPVAILPPAHYPTVSPRINLGHTDSTKPITARVKFSGSGCVWLGKSLESSTLPTGVAAPKVSSSATSRRTCINSKSGGTLPITFGFGSIGNGAATGTVQVLSAPRSGTDVPIPVTVHYSLEMQRPAKAEIRWLVFIVVSALGLLIPVALLYLVKWFASRMPETSIAIARIKGNVDETGKFVPAGGASLSVVRSEVKSVAATGGGRRTLVLSEGGELVAKTGLNPLVPGHVEMRNLLAASGSSLPQVTTRRGCAVLPTAVVGTWVVAIASSATGAEAECLFLLDSGLNAEEQLVADAAAGIPEVVKMLRELLGPIAMPPVNQGDRWGGDDSAQRAVVPPMETGGWS